MHEDNAFDSAFDGRSVVCMQTCKESLIASRTGLVMTEVAFDLIFS